VLVSSVVEREFIGGVTVHLPHSRQAR
jgi:hypothetical protein